MFRSRARPVLFPQAEHARLSGIIAYLWGNDRFKPLPEPVLSYVAGITYHDRGYGLLDDGGIGEVPEAEWLAYQCRGAERAFTDPVAEAIVRLHIVRLLRYSSSPERLRAADKIEDSLRRFIAEEALDQRTLLRSDRITHLCDNVAFDFCFEAPKTGHTAVYATATDDEETVIEHTLHAGGRITLAPWPLAVSEYRGFICAYRSEGYPAALDPVVVPFTLAPS